MPEKMHFSSRSFFDGRNFSSRKKRLFSLKKKLLEGTRTSTWQTQHSFFSSFTMSLPRGPVRDAAKKAIFICTHGLCASYALSQDWICWRMTKSDETFLMMAVDDAKFAELLADFPGLRVDINHCETGGCDFRVFKVTDAMKERLNMGDLLNGCLKYMAVEENDITDTDFLTEGDDGEWADPEDFE